MTSQSNPAASHKYIPQEAYLFFPSPQDAKKSANDRIIFEGNTQFDSQEQQQISQFKSFAQKSGRLDASWSDALILRVLMAQGYKSPKTLEALASYSQWKKSNFPVRMDQKLQAYLNSGIVYVCGRDHKFRPIVVMNVAAIDLKNLDPELLKRYFNFCLEHIIEEWMLPGQVEAWNFIIDVNDVKIGTKAVQTLSKVFKDLQDNYQCRLNSLYIVNTPSSVHMAWKMAKKMLDEITLSKISLLKESSPAALFKIANRSQVEQKYGGSAPNIRQFWPPQQPSNDVFVSPNDSSALISKEQYASKYQKGELKNMIVNTDFINSAAPTSNNQQPKEVPAPNTQKTVPQNQNQFSMDDVVGREVPDQKADSPGATLDSLPENAQNSQSSTKGEMNAKATPEADFYVDSLYEDLIETEEHIHHIKNFEAYFIPLPDMHIKICF